MYDMSNPAPTRSRSSGFVLPSNNEWVKAAYYDPKHGGTDSYWEYPTGPFKQPNVSVLNPKTGDVENASYQPLSTYNPNDPNSSVDTPGAPPGKAPTWCPSQAGPTCDQILPSEFPPGLDLQKNYMANVSTVGQTKTTSPWGTYDQCGNVVEILDTLAPQPPGYNFLRKLALLPRGCRQRAGLPAGDLRLRLLPGGHHLLSGLSVARLPRGHHRKPPIDHAAIIFRVLKLTNDPIGAD